MLRNSCLLALFALLFPLTSLAKGSDTLVFKINGIACPNGQCQINVVELTASSTFYITLQKKKSDFKELSFSLKFQGSAPLSNRITLAFAGTTIAPQEKGLLLAKNQISNLYSGLNPLTLTLPEGIEPNSTLIIEAKEPGSIAPTATLKILFTGLKTPGEGVPWDSNALCPKVTPAQATVYPTSLSNGDIHIDLTPIPKGRSGTVHIFDLLGQTVYTQRIQSGMGTRMPTNRLHKGIYFIRIEIQGLPTYTGRVLIDP